MEEKSWRMRCGLNLQPTFSELDILQEANRKGRIDSSGLTLAAREAEAAGVDRLLIADPTGSQDVASLAAHILHATSTLNVEIQHNAGAVSPEIAARQIATLDQLSGGRVTSRYISIRPAAALSRSATRTILPGSTNISCC